VQFSVIFEAQLADPTPARERRLVHDCIRQALYAEEMGFDRVWAVEHHSLYWYAHMSAPEIFLTAVAAQTSRIRIGHGVVCMPFNYNFPTRVAERAAMLDIVSNGRLDLGGGRGGTQQEMSLCNVDPDRTAAEVREALRIIGHIWLEESFEWHGDLLDIQSPPGAQPHIVVPRPVQEPHPPLFLACTHAETVRTAAEYGVGALAFGFAGTEHVRGMKATMEDRALRGELPQYLNDPSLASATFNIDHAYGTVADAIAYAEELADIGVDEIMCMVQMGTVPHEVCMETIRHWGQEVIPRFRS